MEEKLQKKPTQCDKILKYIRDFGSISSWEAYADLGITQLGARIFNLKEKGYEFTKQRMRTTNRYGEDTYYDRYKLKEN